MTRTLYSALAAILFFGAGCAQAEPSKPLPAAVPQEYAEAERIPAEAAPEPAPAPQNGMQHPKFRGGVVRNNGKAVEVLDAAGKVIASNEDIIRAPDEDGNCPSDGFNRLVAKGDYFTIEQQSCGGMFFMDEYITFKAGRDGRIYLHKFSIIKTDRSDPEKTIPQRDLTTRDFGQIELKDVKLQALYEML